MPKAENTPGAGGMMTLRMPISRATCDGVQRTGAAIGDQREIAGIEAALGGDALDRVGHGGGGDAQDAVGGRRDVQCRAAWRRASSARSAAVDVELHLAAEEAVGAEPAEHQIGVGDGRLGAAEAVAGRAGRGAGALRADAQAAVLDAARSSRRRCRPRKCPSWRSAPAAPGRSRRSAPRRWSAPRRCR